MTERIYPLIFDNYREVMQAVRELRRRGVELVTAVIIVKVDHHNKVKDFLSIMKEKQRDPLASHLLVLLQLQRAAP